MSFSAILLISGVTYIAASLLCLCCPSILAPILDTPTNQSTRRPKLKDISLLRYGGHRGGGVERIENTIAAFDHSIDCGCSLLELDVRLTRDRLIVVTHDGDVVRTTGSSMGKISMIDYKDLPLNLATLSSPPPFSVPGTMTRYLVDASTNQQQYKHAYQMPLLDTVLERYPQAIINIDCKDDSLELADGIADLIEKHDAHDRVVVGSMHERAMQRINQRLPQATKFYNPRAVLGLYLKYITGLLPFTRLSADILEIPYVTHEFRSAILHMLSGRVGERVAGWLIDGLSWIMLRPSFVNHLQQRGVPVVVWVVNSEQEIKDALAKGVTGVMTDRPSLIKKMFPEAALRLQNHQPTSQRMQ